MNGKEQTSEKLMPDEQVTTSETKQIYRGPRRWSTGPEEKLTIPRKAISLKVNHGYEIDKQMGRLGSASAIKE